MVLLSLNTGLRRGELFNLEWRDINSSLSLLTVRSEGAKSGRTRHIPLKGISREVVEKWKQQTAGKGLVFHSPLTGKRFVDAKEAWKNLMLEAQITNYRWHDMRHSFASKLVMAEVNLNTVSELLGQRTL